MSQSYDYLCFDVLKYEFSDEQCKKSESSVKRKLKYHKLGTYDQHRIDMLRRLRDELAAEIKLSGASAYYQKTNSPYAAMGDFDHARLNADFSVKYPQVSKHDLSTIIGAAVDYFYLR